MLKELKPKRHEVSNVLQNVRQDALAKRVRELVQGDNSHRYAKNIDEDYIGDTKIFLRRIWKQFTKTGRVGQFCLHSYFHVSDMDIK